MDDTRCFLQPFKHGWRWVEGKILLCKRWMLEDAELTTTKVTRRILMGSMQVVEDYLSLTTETG